MIRLRRLLARRRSRRCRTGRPWRAMTAAATRTPTVGHDVAGRANGPELGHQVERHAPLPLTQAGTCGYVCALRVEASMTGQVILRWAGV